MVTRKIVVITGTSLVPSAACDYVEYRGYHVRRIQQDHISFDDLHNALTGASGYLIGGHEEPTADHFIQSRALEAAAWIARTGGESSVQAWSGVAGAGVALIDAQESQAVSVAEFTVLLALTMNRPFATSVPTAGNTSKRLPSPGSDLYGQRIGIVGTGRIGSRVAWIAKQGFGMNVAYHAPKRNHALEHALDIQYLRKDDLVSGCDLITLHRPAPAVDEKAEIGTREFDLMNPGTVLINTAHHRLVDLEALLLAAETRGVRGAFDGLGSGIAWERLVALGPERFLAVPSMGVNTIDAYERASMFAARAVCDVLAGGPSHSVVNPDFRDVRDLRSRGLG